MKLMRNKEIQRQLVLSLLLVLLFAAAAGFFLSWESALLLLLSGFLLTLVWLFFTRKRYQSLEELAVSTDRMLHGGSRLDLKQYQEGELSILANEIQKLLKRLTEQSDTLKKEKIYLSDSLADISHQLRTPLTSLHLVLARLGRGDDEAGQRRLIYEGGQLLGRIDWLVESLLKISKIDAGTAVFASERVEAEALAAKALEPFRIPMELREQTLELQITPGSGFAGDFAWSAEALGNILKNCMEHTGQGGNIRLSAEENHLYTEFVIEDNGPGLAPEDLPHLFERFYKGRQSSDSSVGIGLALSRMIIHAQNGTIKAENRPEGGARFTIRFYKGVV